MIKHEKNSNSHVTANATGLLKLAMQESMMIPVLTQPDRRSALAISRNGSLSCNEISMWIYAKAGQNWTMKLYIWVPYSILHTVM